jgi:hypothetical protein
VVPAGDGSSAAAPSAASQQGPTGVVPSSSSNPSSHGASATTAAAPGAAVEASPGTNAPAMPGPSSVKSAGELGSSLFGKVVVWGRGCMLPSTSLDSGPDRIVVQICAMHACIPRQSSCAGACCFQSTPQCHNSPVSQSPKTHVQTLGR